LEEYFPEFVHYMVPPEAQQVSSLGFYRAGNANLKGRFFSTFNLLIKQAFLLKKEKKMFSLSKGATLN
jgi:hypothetical protein